MKSEREIIDGWLAENTDLPVRAAKQVRAKAPSELELDELIGIATLHMVEAARRFPEHCVKKGSVFSDTDAMKQNFLGFVWRRAKGSLLDYLRQLDTASRPQREALKAAGEGLLWERAERAGVSAEQLLVAEAAAEVASVELLDVDESVEDEVAVELHPFMARFAEVVKSWPRDKRLLFILVYYQGYSLREAAFHLQLPEHKIWPMHEECLFSVAEVVESLADSELEDYS